MKKKLLFVLIFYLNVDFALSQVFWQTDFFAAGFPVGWTTADSSANGVKVQWKRCANPTIGRPNGPKIWNDFNGQTFFQASTAANGFMFVDSDLYNINNPHTSRLTTPTIDCSNHSSVWLQFQTHIGVYNFNAYQNAIVRVSKDGVTWENFKIFPQLAEDNPALEGRWSLNVENINIDISSVAANQPNVKIQWQWHGLSEYFWDIDDVKLSASDPRNDFDFRVNRNFFAIPPNLQTPKDQAENILFLADIENVGKMSQTNVNLNISIQNVATNSIVFTNDTNFGTLAADTLVQNIPIAGNGFFPVGSNEITPFRGNYSVESDQTDASPSDNNREFLFVLTDSIFAKESGVNTSIVPPFDAGESHSWGYGNYYYVKKGNLKKATSVTFYIENPSDLFDKSVRIILYEWKNPSNDSVVRVGERTLVGYEDYRILDMDKKLITIPLYNLDDQTYGIPLRDSMGYIAMLEYEDTGDFVDMAVGISTKLNYGASIYRSKLAGKTYFSSVFFKGNSSNSDFETTPFAPFIVPLIRLNVNDAMTLARDVNKVENYRLFPNPASDKIQIFMKNNSKNVTWIVSDILGKKINISLINDENISEITTFDSSKLPNGFYFMTDSEKNITLPFQIIR